MALKRDRATVLAYVGLGLLGFVLNGLGPVLPNLQEELGMTRSEVARYPSLYAVGWLVMSGAGYRVMRRLGRNLALRLGAIGLGVSAGLMGMAPGEILVGVAAIVMGAAGAVMMMVVQAFLSDHHGSSAVAAIAEANAVSSFAAIAGPLAIALAIAIGLGWAAGFAIPALVVGGLLGLGLGAKIPRSVELSIDQADPPDTQSARWLGSWFAIVLVVSLEFAFVFWATDYMESVGGISEAGRCRAHGNVLHRHGRRERPGSAFDAPVRTLADGRSLGALTVSALGFAMFWGAPFLAGTTVWAALGLLVAGVGVAYLFPLSFLGLVGVLVGGTDKASARAALGSGVAIGLAPLLLGIAADALGLTKALLLIPLLIAAAAVNVAMTYPPRILIPEAIAVAPHPRHLERLHR